MNAGEVLKDIFGIDVLIVVQNLILETEDILTHKDEIDSSLDY